MMHRWSIAIMATAATASSPAQSPPSGPSKPNDAAVLEEAIRAVDRAAEKSTTATDKPPAGESTPSRPAAPSGRNGKPAAAPKPKPAEKPASSQKASPAQTLITSLEGGVLDNARNVITFRKNVIVDRPDLKIWCDQLEITLNRSTPKKETPAEEAPGDKDSDGFSADSIKSAAASAPDGGMVVIWRKTTQGDVVAAGRRAIYNSSDGSFTITGRPEVLQNMSFLFHSPGESEKLVMLKNGDASGSKHTEFNINASRAREIRQRLFSHVPGKRPAEASAPGEARPGSSNSASADLSTAPAPALPSPPRNSR